MISVEVGWCTVVHGTIHNTIQKYSISSVQSTLRPKPFVTSSVVPFISVSPFSILLGNIYYFCHLLFSYPLLKYHSFSSEAKTTYVVNPYSSQF